MHLFISVIGQGDAVKATIKCKPGTAAAVLKLLASHRDAGPGVKDACSIPESDDMLQPDAGPFKYLLFEGRPAQLIGRPMRGVWLEGRIHRHQHSDRPQRHRCRPSPPAQRCAAWHRRRVNAACQAATHRATARLRDLSAAARHAAAPRSSHRQQIADAPCAGAAAGQNAMFCPILNPSPSLSSMRV